VNKTPVTAYPPILNPLGPNFIQTPGHTSICFDSTYGKDDRVCGDASKVNVIPCESDLKQLISLFLENVNTEKNKQLSAENLTFAASLTTPAFRNLWNGPQKISNFSNFQEYLFNNMSPFIHLTRVSRWRSELVQIEPNFFTARIQIETMDFHNVSHRYVFEFQRNTEFDTLLNTLPKLEWRISNIYPPLGNMDDIF
jgi:hypothetical protein